MRYWAPQLSIGLQTSLLQVQPCFFQVQASEVGNSSQAMKDCLGINLSGFPLVFEGNAIHASFSGSTQKTGMGINLHAFFLEGLLKRRRDVFIKATEQLLATLNQCRLDPETEKKLSQLESHRPSSEHDDGCGKSFEIQDIVAGPWLDGFQAG